MPHAAPEAPREGRQQHGMSAAADSWDWAAHGDDCNIICNTTTLWLRSAHVSCGAAVGVPLDLWPAAPVEAAAAGIATQRAQSHMQNNTTTGNSYLGQLRLLQQQQQTAGSCASDLALHVMHLQHLAVCFSCAHCCRDA